MKCKICGTEFQENTDFCLNCGGQTGWIENDKPGMKFYIFQAYFSLQVATLLYIITGVLLLSNNLYKFIELFLGNRVGLSVPFMQSEMKFLNAVYGVLLIALAMYYGYVSIALIKLKSGAIRHLYIATVLSEAIGLIYYIAALILMRGFIQSDAETVLLLIRQVISAAISLTLRLLIYSKYYNKRKYLFVN